MIGKIIAIGGGEIGRPGYPAETLAIDTEIIKLSGKNHPRLLFLPTASDDSAFYYDVVKKYFGKKLGAKTDVLYVTDKNLKQTEIKEKIFGADIIYVGGGNTAKLMKIWRRRGVDALLKKAWEKGTVLSGVSAGAICWFRWGSSDSRRFSNPNVPYIKVSGMGFIPALCCPHFDYEKDRQSHIKKIMKATPGVAVALDNCCALEIVGDKF